MSNEWFMVSGRWIGIGAALIAVAIVAGAFGAHGLRGWLSEYALSIYEKAVFYHVTQSLGIVLVGLMMGGGAVSDNVLERVCVMLTVGVVLFSGSLYLLALTGIKWLGAITPFGGTFFIIAWLHLAWSALRRG